MSRTDDLSFTKVIESSIPITNNPYIADILSIIILKIISFPKLFYHLFFRRKFILHRLTGLFLLNSIVFGILFIF